MKIDSSLLLSASDWLINVSAGWFGAAFIVPALAKPPKKVHFVWLTVDIALAIFAFVVAVALKQTANL